MTYRRYLGLTWVERHYMHSELCDMVEDANPPTPEDGADENGGAIRPKRMRR